MDWGPIVIAAIAALPPTLVALLSLRKSKQNEAAIEQVHISINSRLTELLIATAAASRAEGRESMSSAPDPMRKKEG
jgi:hypothetical protein